MRIGESTARGAGDTTSVGAIATARAGCAPRTMPRRLANRTGTINPPRRAGARRPLPPPPTHHAGSRCHAPPTYIDLTHRPRGPGRQTPPWDRHLIGFDLFGDGGQGCNVISRRLGSNAPGSPLWTSARATGPVDTEDGLVPYKRRGNTRSPVVSRRSVQAVRPVERAASGITFGAGPASGGGSGRARPRDTHRGKLK